MSVECVRSIPYVLLFQGGGEIMSAFGYGYSHAEVIALALATDLAVCVWKKPKHD